MGSAADRLTGGPPSERPPRGPPAPRTVRRPPVCGAMGVPGLGALLLCWAAATCAELGAPGGPHRGVDLILDCSLAGEDAHPWGISAGKPDAARATLVLRQVPVPDDGALDGFTDFPGVTAAQGDAPIVFEASVDRVRLPHAEVLLHAACQEKVVTCELSRLPQARQEPPAQESACFMGAVQVSGGGFSVSMVMKTLGGPEGGAPLHPQLNLPLSPRGTVLASVEFQVMTQKPSIPASLGASASLPCGFSGAPGSGPFHIEWRRQHRGQGQRVYVWAGGQGQALREGARLEPQELLEVGDASLTLPGLTLRDEGAYICQISSAQYQAQQIIQLSILETPKVRLDLVAEALPPTLLCAIAGYYPLDVAVSWTREEPGGAPTPASGASFSSHRQSRAGTYSLSSSLRAEPGPRGATYACQVAHVSLPEPITLEIWVGPPEQGAPLGSFLATGLFFLALLFLGLRRRRG
ncbi:tapasin-related protein isoform X2 [Antechinus flavipes]|uniref:tapasin-related protein isoform X2 n=1 Tax=Antechinus flavipes TaxID=38775 RepID=UPI002235DF1C|nr:tapasin-related protein isoform X2 [Antechinus flavipes]